MTSEEVPASDIASPEPVSSPAPVISASLSQESPVSRLKRLRQRIASRTTDLLAIGIVLVVSLTMGRQMLGWWHEAPPAVLDLGPLEGLEAEWGGSARPVSLEFGNSPLSLIRQVIPTGTLRTALDVVRQRCQSVLLTAPLPDLPLDESERQQLSTLDKLKPQFEQPGLWRLYVVGGGLPMVIGVKSFPVDRTKIGPPVISQPARVICWGLVFPGLARGEWITYTFTRRSTSEPVVIHSDTDFKLRTVELPVGCQKTLLMQEPGQSGLLGFEGRGDASDWQQHFTRSLAGQGWRQLEPGWQSVKGGLAGRFVKHDSEQGDDSSLQIQWHQNESGVSVGLIQLFPGRSERQELAPAVEGTP